MPDETRDTSDCVAEEFPTVVHLTDRIEAQARDLGARDEQIDQLRRENHELRNRTQVAEARLELEREEHATALEIACRKAKEAQENFMIAERARGELQKTVTLLEAENAAQRVRIDGTF